MADRDSQPGIEFAHAKGLGHVVIGAAIQRFDLAVFGAVRGQHEDGRVAPGPDAPADLQPVQVGEAQVEHDDVRGADRRFGESLVSCLRGPHEVPESFQADPADVQQARIVINDENLRQAVTPRVVAPPQAA